MKKNDMHNRSEQQDDAYAFNANTDENIAGDQHLNEPMSADPETERLRAQVDELNDKYLRQAAEFDNFKRRNARERIDLIQTAGRDVIADLLDVLDDSERAQKQLDTATDVSQIREGIQLVFTKLRNTLASKGLKPMEALNKEFNPDLHEAITETDAGPDMSGKIVAEIQKGYYLNDKIIRFAKVVVGK